MTELPTPRARRAPRVPFLTWGWAMLLVVLLSATPTGAQVHTRMVGSAFDPASAAVALSPKQPKAKGLAKAAVGGLPVRHGDGPPSIPGATARLEPLPALPAEVAPLPVPPAPRLVWSPLSSSAHGARAPPRG